MDTFDTDFDLDGDKQNKFSQDGRPSIADGIKLKATCLQDELMRALSIISTSVAPRTATLPVMTHVLIVGDMGQLTIVGSNLEQAMSVKIGARIQENGAICLPYKTLSDLVSTLLGPIELDISGTVTAKIKAGRVSANIKGIDSPEFPIVPDFDKRRAAIATLPVSVFKKALSMVAFAAAIDGARPMLTGVQFNFSGKTLTLAATDGFRLARYIVELAEPVNEPSTFLVPAKALRDLVRALPGDAKGKDKEPKLITIQAGEFHSSIVFSVDDISMGVQLLDQKFPEIEHIIPKKYTTRAVVSRGDLLRACRQANVFAREALDTLRLDIKPEQSEDTTRAGVIELSARADETGDGEISVEAMITGDALPTAYNVKFLAEFLNEIDAPQVALELSSSRSAGVFRAIGDDDFLYVIMPMNLPR